MSVHPSDCVSHAAGLLLRIWQVGDIDPSQLVAGHLQMFTENSLLYPVLQCFYSHSFYYFQTAHPDIVKCH